MNKNTRVWAQTGEAHVQRPWDTACTQPSASLSFSHVFVTGHSVAFLVSELGFDVCGFLALLRGSITEPG